MFQPHRMLSRALPPALKHHLRKLEARLKFYCYFCPVCQRGVGQFISLRSALPGLMESWQLHGFDVQKFAQAETLNLWQYACPYCRANDRSRLYALFLRAEWRRIQAGQTRRLLDIAPSRPLRKMIFELGCFDYRCADLNMPDVHDRIDITAMTLYEDNRFDCILCSHVLEHVPDDRRALSELFRVLKPGGWAVVMVPISLALPATIEDVSLQDPGERIRRFGQDDHIRLYAKKDFNEKLSEAGFSVDELGAAFFGLELFY